MTNPELDVLCLICGAKGVRVTDCGHDDALTPLPTSTHDANGEPYDAEI